MKTLLSLLAVTLLLAVPTARADERQSISLDFFYDNLEPYGSWREIGDFGYCWQPSDVEDDWRPYSDGRWVYTDAGWTWDSEEPYSWAVYHYGRWANVENVGWVWVPGTEWGPGWVSWRHSPRYVGWAPLPPEALFRVDIGLNAWVDDYYDIGPSSYRFVEGHNLGARRLNTVFVDQRENVSIIHQTTNITNITYVNNTVHNGGLRYDQQFRQSADPIPRYKLDRLQSFDHDDHQPTAERLRSRLSGDSLSVFAAPFANQALASPNKVSRRLDQVHVDRGWSKAGSPAQLNALREQMRGQVRPPENLPPRAKNDRSKSKDEPAVQDRMPGRNDSATKGRDNRQDKPRIQETPPIKPAQKPTVKDPRTSQPSEPRPKSTTPAPGKDTPVTPRRNDPEQPRKKEPSQPARNQDAPPQKHERQPEQGRGRPSEASGKPAPQRAEEPPPRPKAKPPNPEPNKPKATHPEAEPPQQRPHSKPPGADAKRPEAPKPTQRPKATPPQQHKPAPVAPKAKEKPSNKDKKKKSEETLPKPL
jgi:hypothetical protein